MLHQTTYAEPKPKASWWRVLLAQLLLLHVGTYAVVMTGLFMINLIAGIGHPWFLLPAFGWGLFVALHGLLVYLLLNVRIARGIATRSQRRNDPGYRRASRNVTAHLPKPRNVPEIQQLLVQGRAVLEEMRASVRTIPDPHVRNQAFATCEASGMVLEAIEEHRDEVPLARDFLHRFLQPAAKLIGDYARLAVRNVPSAQEMLREVEKNDLPRLTARANAMFDRVHRGTIIDLAVAREMMALDIPDDDPSGHHPDRPKATA
jgi:2TM domain